MPLDAVVTLTVGITDAAHHARARISDLNESPAAFRASSMLLSLLLISASAISTASFYYALYGCQPNIVILLEGTTLAAAVTTSTRAAVYPEG